MIKLILLITITLFIVVVSIGVLGEDSGYVYIKVQNMNIEMSFLLLIIIWIGFAVTLHFAWRALSRLFNLKNEIEVWQRHRNLELAHKRLSTGFIELGNGNYKKAEKLLTSAAEKTEYSLVPLIGAANAAQQLGDAKTRNFLLNKALEQNAEASVALNLTKADYLLNLGNYEESQKILDSLGGGNLNNSLALKIQTNILSRTSQWDKLLPLIPKLYKKTNFSDEEILQLEYQAYRYQLINADIEADLQSVWKKTPKALQSNKGILIEYVHKLKLLQKCSKASDQILKYLKKTWDEDLAIMYSELPVNDSVDQISNLKEWLKDNQSSAKLYLAMAKLYIRKELWVMAKDQLKISIKLEDSLVAQDLLSKTNIQIKNFEV